MTATSGGARFDSLGDYERAAVRTVERHGFAVVERTPAAPGCWVVWNYDQSYSQHATKVFGAEVEALRWALGEAAGHRVTFVPWGQSPGEVVSADPAPGGAA